MSASVRPHSGQPPRQWKARTYAMSTAIRRTASFGVPWENAYRYVQAVRLDNTIYVSGQLPHTMEGQLFAPAVLGADGKPVDFSTMEAQMRRTYENAQLILAELGASLDDVVEETLFTVDVPAAFAASGAVRPAAYGQTVPQVASNLIGVAALAFPEQLIEIAFRAEVRA
jgi:enamine deaminase RidA (YjgF/YER057c/UK114 family)